MQTKSHHDNSRTYEEANSAAAAHGRIKMDEIIHKGLANARAVAERVQSTHLQDRIAKADQINVFSPDDKTWRIESDGAFALQLHPHAFGQVVDNAGMPRKFVDEMVQQANGTRWGAELISHNLHEIFKHRPKQRNLIREEAGVAKGFLSDKFRRIDSRPLLDSFMAGCTSLGLVPIDGVGMETKVRMRAVLPKVFEPIPNEVMIFGLEWGNSDFGDGGHVVNLWTMRVWCTNLAIANSVLKQIHLGKRLSDDISYSDRTLQLDTEANRSALKDAMKHTLGSGQVNLMLKSIQTANEKEINGQASIDKLLKAALTKTELEKVTDIFDGPDVVNVPEGKTQWRLSNAVSFFAQADGVAPERKLELQQVAGRIAGVRDAKESSALAV